MKEFMAAGANIVLGKPMRRGTLESLVRFVEVEGFVPKPGFVLVDKGIRFEWVDSV